MTWGITTYKDVLEIVLQIVGVIAIGTGVLSYFITHKQLNFSVIIACVERFQKILVDLDSSNKDRRLAAIKQYIDLCNEELFYFKKNYLPDEVIDEWLDGMIHYLPLLDSKGNNLNDKETDIVMENNLLKDYPRIRHSFRADRRYDLTSLDQKRHLLDIIKRNIKKNPF